MNFKQNIIIITLAAFLGGCGMGDWFNKALPDRKKVDYKTSRTTSSLEVPPDLSSPTRNNSMSIPGASGTATYSGYRGQRKRQAVTGRRTVLADVSKIRFVRDRDRFWLVIKGEPARIWPRVRDFFLRNGFILRVDNPTIGVMETGWAENRANIPDGAIRRILGKSLGNIYSSGTRDKFRVRLERGSEPGTTELFLTHKGMQEIVQGDNVNPEGTIWKPRKTDHELEVEMIKLLMVHIGVEQQRAKQIIASGKKKSSEPQARLFTARDGSMSLLMNEPYPRAWRIAGLALDRVGFAVEDRNRSKGLYYVRYQDPEAGARKKKGFLSRIFSWGSKKKPVPSVYQVYLKQEGNKTRVIVLDSKGTRGAGETGKRILKLMYEQLK